MTRERNGFTIVELLVVIVVIGILAGIALVSWSGVQLSAQNSAREQDTRQWAGTFDTYKARYIVYPLMPTNSTTPNVTCLGDTGTFPTATQTTGGSKCGQYKSSTTTSYASTSSSLKTEVTKVGTMLSNNGPVVENVLVGPIAYISQTANSGTIPVEADFINFFERACPTTDFIDATSNYSTKFPQLSTLLPSGSSTKVCYLKSTFSYTPG